MKRNNMRCITEMFPTVAGSACLVVMKLQVSQSEKQ